MVFNLQCKWKIHYLFTSFLSFFDKINSTPISIQGKNIFQVKDRSSCFYTFGKINKNSYFYFQWYLLKHFGRNEDRDTRIIILSFRQNKEPFEACHPKVLETTSNLSSSSIFSDIEATVSPNPSVPKQWPQSFFMIYSIWNIIFPVLSVLLCIHSDRSVQRSIKAGRRTGWHYWKLSISSFSTKSFWSNSKIQTEYMRSGQDCTIVPVAS